MANQTVNKCSFCKYFSGKACMAKPDSFYCKEATNEFYGWLKSKQPQAQNKSRGKYPWK